MPSTTLTLEQLDLSPYNVRTDARDIAATGALEASLLEEGQLLPLVVHPMAGRKGVFGVFAGGRRLRAFRQLVKDGKLPKDHPIDVVVRDLPPAKLIELSTTENLIRRDLRDYEVAAAVLAAHRKGRSAEDLAKSLGQESLWVKRNLRLASLAPEIFAAFAAEQLSFDQAAAFAATEDQELQLVVLAEIAAQGDYPHHKTPEAIRRRLKIGDRELARLLRFVGEEKYREAGGRYELDLFADDVDQRGRIVDEGLLRQLADDAMASFRDDLRRRTGRDLRFVVQPPRNDYGTDYSLQVHPKDGDADAIVLPEGEIVAYLQPSEEGPPAVTWWWESRKAKFGSAKETTRKLPSAVGGAMGLDRGCDAAQAVNAAIKEQDGVTQDGIETFRSIRRAVMRAALIEDANTGGEVGLDFLVWSQVMLGEMKLTTVSAGAHKIPDISDPAVTREHVERTRAFEVWEITRRDLLGRPSFSKEDPVASFAAYRREPISVKNIAAAIVAGMSLDRSLNAHGYIVPLHDAIGDACGLAGDLEGGIRDLWSPTEALLQRLPREQLLTIAEPFAEPAALQRWRKGKASELPPLVTRLLLGLGNAYRDVQAQIAARKWVHPLLRFRAPVETPDPVDAAAQIADADELLERAAA